MEKIDTSKNKIILKTKVQLSKWGNSEAIRIRKEISAALDAHEGEELSLSVYESPYGKKYLVIGDDSDSEPNPEKLLADFSEFKGILKGKVDPDLDMKDIRDQRLSERMAKYESLD